MINKLLLYMCACILSWNFLNFGKGSSLLVFHQCCLGLVLLSILLFFLLSCKFLSFSFSIIYFVVNCLVISTVYFYVFGLNFPKTKYILCTAVQVRTTYTPIARTDIYSFSDTSSLNVCSTNS